MSRLALIHPTSFLRPIRWVASTLRVRAAEARARLIGDVDADSLLGAFFLAIAILIYAFLGCILDAVAAEAHGAGARTSVDVFGPHDWLLLTIGVGLIVLTIGLAIQGWRELPTLISAVDEPWVSPEDEPEARELDADEAYENILAEARRREQESLDAAQTRVAETMRNARHCFIAMRMSDCGAR